MYIKIKHCSPYKVSEAPSKYPFEHNKTRFVGYDILFATVVEPIYIYTAWHFGVLTH